MITNDTHSLRSLLKVIDNRKVLIVKTTLALLIVGTLAYFIFPRRYKAETVFVLTNPRYSDRSNIYGAGNKQNEYLADEDDITRLISMAGADSFQRLLIAGMRLDKAYEYDTSDNEEMTELKKLISRRLSIYRAEDNNVVLHYDDSEPERAAAVANYAVPLLEKGLRTFYNNARNELQGSLARRIHSQDSAIAALTDTLVRLREEYGIYDIINPSRHNIMSSSVQNNGRPGFARGMELVQNIESIKDEMVASRAGNITLLGQYTTGVELNNKSLATIITYARVPVEPELTIFVIWVLCAMSGLFFSSLYIVYSHYFYNRSSVR